jgi:hypothetical protein
MPAARETDVPESETPDRLYHYTDARGLLGILESRKLWASDVRLLNDARELDYAADLVRRWLDDLSGLLPGRTSEGTRPRQRRVHLRPD